MLLARAVCPDGLPCIPVGVDLRRHISDAFSRCDAELAVTGHHRVDEADLATAMSP
jgi:hypothetical protein